MEYSTCRERRTKKKSESPTGKEPMTFSHRSDALATEYSIYSYFFSELKIHHLSLFITIGHLAVCRTFVTTNSVNMTSLATSLPVPQWLERPTGDGRSWVRFPSGTQIFSLSHARDMLNIPSILKFQNLCVKSFQNSRQCSLYKHAICIY